MMLGQEADGDAAAHDEAIPGQPAEVEVAGHGEAAPVNNIIAIEPSGISRLVNFFRQPGNATSPAIQNTPSGVAESLQDVSSSMADDVITVVRKAGARKPGTIPQGTPSMGGGQPVIPKQNGGLVHRSEVPTPGASEPIASAQGMGKSMIPNACKAGLFASGLEVVASSIEAAPSYIKGEQSLRECAVPVAKKTSVAFVGGVVGYGGAAYVAPAFLTPLGIVIVGGSAAVYGGYTYVNRIYTGVNSTYQAYKETRAA